MDLLRRFTLTSLSLLLLVTLSSCSSGGGAVETSSSPAAYYKGATTQASLDKSNAEGMTLDSFFTGNVGTNFGTASMVSQKQEANGPTIIQLAQAFKSTYRNVEVPARTAVTPDSKTMAKGARASNLIFGNCGGSYSYDLNVNDTSGDFTGKIVYNDYCTDGLTFAGPLDLTGNFDWNSNRFTRFKSTFDTLQYTDNQSQTFTLHGNTSWVFAGNLSETLTMDMVLAVPDGGKSYWLHNYRMTFTNDPDSVSQDISGRYYNYDFGYVDFVTEQTIITNSGDAWPSSGILILTGKDGSRTRLTFGPYQLEIALDRDHDNVWEWSEILQSNPPPPPANQPPIADAGTDQVVKEGEKVTLDGSGSYDPDGDTLSYYWQFQACPSNCPSLAGYNTLSPSFLPTTTGLYTLSLYVYDGKSTSTSDQVAVTVNSVTPANPSLLSTEWKHGLYGTNIGKSGISILDLDKDGRLEIVAAGSAGGFGDKAFWYVVRSKSSGDYEQVWISDSYASNIQKILAKDADGDGTGEIYVALADGTIKIYDGVTYTETGSFQVGSNITAMTVADADGDGKNEVVVSDGVKIYVYALADHTLEWSSTAWGGNDLAVGNVDDDPAPEIVTTTNGGHGYVVDGVSHTLEWDYLNSFGTRVELGDLDGDGRQEIVGAASWYKITIFDADIKTPSWEINTDLDIDSLRVGDIDGNGVPEIIYGDGQWGEIHAVSPTTRQEIWQITNPEHGTTDIGFGDTDNDGIMEVVWGAGGSSTGPDHLYVADTNTLNIEWESLDVTGPLSAVDVGDVDDDGVQEIVMVSFESNSGYDEGIIHIFNAVTHELEWAGPLGIMDWMGVRSVKIGDVDDDGQTEFVVTTGDVYDGEILVFDGKTHTLENQTQGYGGNFFTTLQIGDVDGDGNTEIVAGQGREHTGSPGNYVIVFDGKTLAEKWKSVILSSGWTGVTDLALADSDQDGNLEIIASVEKSQIWVIDGVTHHLDWLGSVNSSSLTAADLDGDGNVKILAGNTDGTLTIIDGKSYSMNTVSLPPLSQAINALQVNDLDGDGTNDLLVSANDRLHVFNGATQNLTWRSGDLGANLGSYNHIPVRDIDGDGKKEVVIGAQNALYQFQ